MEHFLPRRWAIPIALLVLCPGGRQQCGRAEWHRHADRHGRRRSRWRDSRGARDRDRTGDRCGAHRAVGQGRRVPAPGLAAGALHPRSHDQRLRAAQDDGRVAGAGRSQEPRQSAAEDWPAHRVGDRHRRDGRRADGDQLADGHGHVRTAHQHPDEGPRHLRPAGRRARRPGHEPEPRLHDAGRRWTRSPSTACRTRRRTSWSTA